MEDLKITLFGSPTMKVGGRTVDPGRRKVLALLSYLAVADGGCGRETICALLWPEKDAAAAHAELRRTMSALRRCVGSDVIEATRGNVAFSPDVFVDVREFKKHYHFATAGDHGAGSSGTEQVRTMERAAALYTADFLSGFSLSDSAEFDNWTMFEAERLRAMASDLLERLSRPELLLSDGRQSETSVLDYARRWLMLDDLNEAAHRRLMELYALSGKRGAAFRQFEACRNKLDQELGVEPESETIECRRKIESGELVSLAPARAQQKKARNRLAVTSLVAAIICAAAMWGLLWNGNREQGGGITVAVLPLADNSVQNSENWFASGMTEAIITDLAKISALRVTSRTSSEAVAASRPEISAVREQLGVDYVVEGSVLSSNGQVRVTAQLIDTLHDKHVWAGDYESELSDVIDLQSRIAFDIASNVQAKLSGRERAALAETRAVDPAAYQRYLVGSYEFARLPFDINLAPKCLEDLTHSVSLDPTFAPAHAALANYYWGATQFGLYTSGEGMKRAMAEAKRAVALDPGLAEAHTVLGFVYFLHDFNWYRSEQEFQKAITLKPSSAEAHRWYGSLLCTRGRFDEAIREVNEARNIDPLSLLNILNVAMRLYYARDYDRALREAGIARDMEENFYMSHMVLGYALAGTGRYPEATYELETAARLAGEGAIEPLAVLSYVYNRAERPGDARNAEKRLRELDASGIEISPLLLSYIPLGSGDYSAAMDLIEQAYSQRDLNLAWNFQDPFFDPLRSLPRFQDMKKAMNL